ncbi:MAG: hypothetical protein MZU97_12030 [Bacillus subtilis]|nr:hypothetical protein [Bacillus subtilis]
MSGAGSDGRATEAIRGSPGDGLDIVLTIDRRDPGARREGPGPAHGVGGGPEARHRARSWRWSRTPGTTRTSSSRRDGGRSLREPSSRSQQSPPQPGHPIVLSPASTFKAVLTTGILEENAFPPAKGGPLPGEISYGDRVFRLLDPQARPRQPGPDGSPGAILRHLFLDRGRGITWESSGIVSYSKEFGFGTAAGHRPSRGDRRVSSRPRSGRSGGSTRNGSAATR